MNHIVKIMSATTLSCLMASAWADISSGLVAHYLLDGNATDQTGQYHGSNDGAKGTLDRFGNRNGAVSFDGESEIRVDNFDALKENSDISVTFWVSPKVYDNYLNVFGIGYIDSSSENSTFRAEFQDDSFYGFFDGKRIHVKGQTMVPVDEWTFIALTHDNSTEQSKLYVNGNLYNVLEDSRIEFASPTTLTIGIGFRADDEHFFQGTLDDFRLYDRALSKADVQELYRACPVDGTCPMEPAYDEAQIDYYRDEKDGDLWKGLPAWHERQRIREPLPDNMWEYGLRSLFLARYACWEPDVRTWMPENLISAVYHCTDDDDDNRREVIDHLQSLIDLFEEQLEVQEKLAGEPPPNNKASDDKASDNNSSDDNSSNDSSSNDSSSNDSSSNDSSSNDSSSNDSSSDDSSSNDSSSNDSSSNDSSSDDNSSDDNSSDSDDDSSDDNSSDSDDDSSDDSSSDSDDDSSDDSSSDDSSSDDDTSSYDDSSDDDTSSDDDSSDDDSSDDDSSDDTGSDDNSSDNRVNIPPVFNPFTPN
jgi:hypothetical protein